MSSEYLTRAEVAALYPISQSYLEKAKPEKGGPPVIRVGRKVLFKRSQFEAWLDGFLVGSVSAVQPQKSPQRRRGRPTKAEQIARRAAQ